MTSTLTPAAGRDPFGRRRNREAPPIEPAQAQRELVRIFRGVRAIQPARWVDAGASEIRDQLLPELSKLLDGARALVDSIEALSAWSAEVAGARDPAAAEGLHDTCSVTAMVLAQKAQAVSRSRPEANAWAALSATEWALEETARALLSIERQLCAAFGLSSKTAGISFVTESLEVRRILTRLRCSILRQTDGSTDAETALRATGTSFARLLGDDRSRSLRIDDLIHARQLRQRVVEWFRSAERSESEAEHLLVDIQAFAVLLADINLREELVDHDREAVGHAITALAEGAAESAPPEAVIDRLATLFGRDDELDEMLERGCRSFELLRALRRIERALSAAEDGAPVPTGRPSDDRGEGR